MRRTSTGLILVLMAYGATCGILPGEREIASRWEPRILETLNNAPNARTLLLREQRHETNANASSQQGIFCHQFNDDPCGCVSRGCDFNVGAGNICVADQIVCRNKDFYPGECRRQDSFYSVGGVVCRNTVASGDCDRDLDAISNIGINLNGHGYVDDNGIKYQAQNISSSSKPNHVVHYRNASAYGTSICKKAGRGDIVDLKHFKGELSRGDQKHLLWNYLEGSRGSQSDGIHGDSACSMFNIHFVEDGVFELTILAAEMEWPHQNVRQFDITMNDVVIFPKVDIFRLVGRQCYVADLVLNFVVRSNRGEIILSGYPPMKLGQDGKTNLGICISDCETNGRHVVDTSYIASAFSIIKLKGQGPLCA